MFFRQERVGFQGRRFQCYKFRTMVPNADHLKADLAHMNERKCVLFKIVNDPRITRFGAFLRRSSMDELPQFINVLQGRMSIVGPRPHAVAHNEQYRSLIQAYMVRHKVRPGITGWAQINLESDLEQDAIAKLEYDLYYIKNMSASLDIYILLHTVKAVVLSRGADCRRAGST